MKRFFIILLLPFLLSACFFDTEKITAEDLTPKNTAAIIQRAENDLSDEYVKKIKAATEDQKNFSKMMKLARESTDAKMLNLLVQHENPGVRASAAKNEYLPTKWQESLSKDESITVLQYLAASPILSAEISKKLSENPATEVRWVVARNQKTPHDILKTLAHDSSPVVQQKLTLNPSIGADIQLEIAKTSPANVVVELIKNQNLSPEAIATLKERSEESIQKALDKKGIQ